MEKIGLVTDEGADLPEAIIKEHRIVVAPMKMHWPDLENLAGENTFQKMRQAQKAGIESFGKTSQPSPRDFLAAFEKQLACFEKVIAVTISSRLSGTYNSALQARNFLEPRDQERIFLVDSMNVSSGQALFILLAIDLIKAKKQTGEIINELEKLPATVRLIGIIEDPKWLEASGRISPVLAGWLRRAARIGVRPLMGIKDGAVASGGVVAGAKDIPQALFKKFESGTKQLRKENKKIKAVITHGDAREGAERLKKMMESSSQNTEVAFVSLIDNVIGTLTGPDSMILSWCKI
jgi:DegV family protein with EDD domain